MLGDLDPHWRKVEHLTALDPYQRRTGQAGTAATAHRRLGADLVVGDLDLLQRRSRLALRTARPSW